MKIAVVTEVSTREKNSAVIRALEGCGHQVLNAGMRNCENEPELTYIQTGLISAILLNSGAAELVIGGCGTGIGYINSVMQYPGVTCGLVTSPLDAWLFRQINGGNCISLALNKGFGWAGDENLRFIFERFFSVKSGGGYPPHRMESQQASRKLLEGISLSNHYPMTEIIGRMDRDLVRRTLSFPGLMEILEKEAVNKDILLACRDCL